MVQLHVNIDDETAERLRTRARLEGSTPEQVAAEQLRGIDVPDVSQLPGLSIWGIFSDSPEMVDEMVADIYHQRRTRPARLPS